MRVTARTAVEQLRDSRLAARAARLRYVDAREPGLTRKRHGRTFRYYAPDGREVRSPRVLSRIARMVIPPAWAQVWICQTENGHRT